MSKKTVVYKPEPCKGEGALFSGQVVVSVPSYEERMELMLEADMLDNEDVKNIGKNEAARMMLKMVKASYPFYERVDVTHKESKQHYKSVDDLRYSPNAGAILNDVATYLLKADGLGKS